MATIQGREAMIDKSGGGWWYIFCETGGNIASYMRADGHWHSCDPTRFPTEAAAQAFIEQHCDKPATPAAEVAENHISDAGKMVDVEVADLKSLFRKNADGGVYAVLLMHESRFVEVVSELLARKPTPVAESDSGEIERLRTELAAARAERDEAKEKRKEGEAMNSYSNMREIAAVELRRQGLVKCCGCGIYSDISPCEDCTNSSRKAHSHAELERLRLSDRNVRHRLLGDDELPENTYVSVAEMLADIKYRECFTAEDELAALRARAEKAEADLWRLRKQIAAVEVDRKADGAKIAGAGVEAPASLNTANL